MNFPDCYLADLPAEAEMSSTLIDEAWVALGRNRDQHLVHLKTDSVIRVLSDAAGLWLEGNSPFMDTALTLGPAQLGFSVPTLESGLRQLFSALTVPQLERWIEQDLGHPHRLDGFCASAPESASLRRSKAVGPPALAHITAGNIPASAVMSMSAGLLLRSAQFIKCATSTSLVPRLFAHSIREVDAHLGACLELAEWPRTRKDLTEALVKSADCVTATGTDETVGLLRQQVPVQTRFVGHGHRLSFAYVSKDCLNETSLPRLLTAAAEDVCSWNQLGCLSPHVIYIESGSAVTAEAFAAQLASTLARLENTHPRGPLPTRESATIRSRRSFYEVRGAHSSETLLWQSVGSTAWTVIYESDPQFQASCLNRFLYVKRVADLEAALQGADRVRRQVSTVALAASGARKPDMVNRLAEWGVNRICPIGSMQKPPVLWRHDGRPALEELVWWTDLEEE